MRQKPPSVRTVAFVIALAALPATARAQAFTAPQGIGTATVSWQLVDNTGHRLSDGFLNPVGQSITTSFLLEVEYGFTDRFSASFGIPYVYAKYTGANAPFSGLPIDQCRCWQSSFQDLGFSARYRLGGETWAVTPTFRYGHPSHDYAYAGEAVVGKNLDEAQIGVSAGWRLVNLLPKATVQTAYTYAFVESPLPDLSIDRSNGFMDFGYALTSRLYVRGTGIWQYTHGGLRFGSPTGDPFFPPGDLNTPEEFAQRDRVIKTLYWQLGSGVSFSAGPLDIFGSITKYIWGRDAHNGWTYNVGTSWYFDLSR